jgi:hypothetical protein
MRESAPGKHASILQIPRPIVLGATDWEPPGPQREEGAFTGIAISMDHGDKMDALRKTGSRPALYSANWDGNLVRFQIRKTHRDSKPSVP